MGRQFSILNLFYKTGNLSPDKGSELLSYSELVNKEKMGKRMDQVVADENAPKILEQMRYKTQTSCGLCLFEQDFAMLRFAITFVFKS